LHKFLRSKSQHFQDIPRFIVPHPEKNPGAAKTPVPKEFGPMITVLVIILLLMLIGAFPAWPYSRGWGYYPSGGIGLILLIIVILALLRVF
jgi:hypothetical protein